MVAEKPVVIFSKSTCCLSHSVTSLIRSFGANPTVYELDEMSNGQQIESALLQMGCKPSVPAVFIGQQFTGGSKKIMSLHVRNELVPMLKNAGAIWIWDMWSDQFLRPRIIYIIYIVTFKSWINLWPYSILLLLFKIIL